jgi:hypothetical protein
VLLIKTPFDDPGILQSIPPLPKLQHIRGMPNYRRNRVSGGTFCFTVNLLDHRSALLDEIDELPCGRSLYIATN